MIMKRMVLVLIIAALVVGGAFAQMSAGVGLKGSFMTSKMEMGSLSAESKANGIGANVFLDVKFAEVNIDYLVASDSDDAKAQVSYLGLGVVGKYPIALGDKFEIFPFAGIEYLMLLGASYDGTDVSPDDKGDYSRLSILLGVGFDFSFTDSIFLRAEVGYGIGLNTKAEQDQIDAAKDLKITNGQVPYKIAIGFKF
jgi:opacity protein-like surface antigen